MTQKEKLVTLIGLLFSILCLFFIYQTVQDDIEKKLYKDGELRRMLEERK